MSELAPIQTSTSKKAEDFTEIVDVQLPELKTLAIEHRKFDEAIEKLGILEKKQDREEIPRILLAYLLQW